MEKILLAIDADGSAQPAAQAVIAAYRKGDRFELHLLNVQPRGAGHTEIAGGQEPEAYYQSRGETVLAPVCRLLQDAGVAFERHILTGPAAPAIVAFVRSQGISRIIMGAHRRGRLAGWLSGSVVADVSHHVDIPVEIVPCLQ